MSSWKEIIQNYLIRYSTQMRKTTKPLTDRFGVSGFAYHRIDNNGNYTILCSRPDWIELYSEAQLYLNDPYLRHPKFYRSGMCLVEHFGTDEFKKHSVSFMQDVLHMNLDVVLIQKNADCVEFFRFEANTKTSSLQNIYMNHPNLLKSFASYFKKEMAGILNGVSQDQNSLLELKGQDFYCDQTICPEIDTASRLGFLNDLKYEIGMLKRLSSRETDCLTLLLKDKSAKETAAILGISRRTVESYFENIKNKFSCNYKSDVLTIARNLQELDLLP